jgi:HPt (histidine-containing phosphotransfer) domain-containing protein
MTSADKLGKQIDDLWQKHLPLMRSRIETIRLAVDATHNNRLTQDTRIAAKDAAHKLAGSLGTFGLEYASVDALEIERLLTDDAWIGENPTLLDQHLARIKQAIYNRGNDAGSTARA